MKLLIVSVFLISFLNAQQKLDANYDGGETLQIIQRSYQSKVLYDYTVSLDTPLYSIYWNPATTNYYFVEDGLGMMRTNGLTYKIDTNKLETSYTGENLDPFLIFVGYISPDKRLYIDNRDTNQQYIKVLEPITDYYYLGGPLVPDKSGTASGIGYSLTGESWSCGTGRSYKNRGAIIWEEPDFPF
ncbi:MAG: hypothetical protein ACRC0X_04490 [Brevinema sp.]